MERLILEALFADRACYEELNSILEDSDFGAEGKVIFDEVKYYYDKDKNAKYIEKEIIVDNLTRKLPEKHLALFKDLVLSFNKDVSVPNILSVVKQNREVRLKEELASALLSGKDYRPILSKLEEINYKVESKSEVFNGTDYEDIMEQYSSDNIIPIWPKSLNDKIGGLVPETNILIYGRPEIGKSMLSINNACYLASRGIRTLYFGNEDPHRNMRMRMLSCITGLNREQLLSKSTKDMNKIIQNKGLENLYFQPGHPGSIREIEYSVKRLNCTAVVIDQLKNLKSLQNDSRVLQLEYLGQDARALAKKHGLVVFCVVQAGDSGNNKRILGLGDVDFSNTGLPGAADLMLGFGANEDDVIHNERYISIAKNKLSGNHDSVKVKVDPKLSRVFDLV